MDLLFYTEYVFLWMKEDVSTFPPGARYAVQFTVTCPRFLQPLAVAIILIRMREKYLVVNRFKLPELVDFCYFYGENSQDNSVSGTLFYNRSFRRIYKDISTRSESDSDIFVSTYRRRWGITFPISTWNISIADATSNGLMDRIGQLFHRNLNSWSQTRTIFVPFEGSDLVIGNSESSDDNQ
ncbi:hypothetical protein DFP72DRAFT_852533 [Ephemerocybe angulata]|uniref:Uncharacterized protein n=1 Tax=Ephemerocybe angulata TaxID=980116 RepID=A0A8H6HND9_9AGAR|nr:hypothetical protein DFP72DRAFT_852533 [Tulosesus angulatus]